MNLKHEWHDSFWFMQQGPLALGAGAGARGITSALVVTFLASLRTEAPFTCPELSLPEPKNWEVMSTWAFFCGYFWGYVLGCYWICFSCPAAPGSADPEPSGFFELDSGQQYMSTDLTTLARLVRDLTVRVRDLENNNLELSRRLAHLEGRGV